MYIRSLYDYDCEDVCKLTSSVFVKNEPMCKCLNMTEEEFMDAFYDIIYKCCDSGCSYCMKDHETNEILSIMLTLPYIDYKNIQLPEWTNDCESVAPLLNILDDVSYEKEFEIDSTLYLFIACTKSNMECKGLAKLLLNKVIDKAQYDNYKYLVADATNIISQHILINKYGFQNIKEISYDEFEYNEKYIFKDIKDTKNIIRVMKKLI